MKVSFKSIENIKILKHIKEQEGPYTLPNGQCFSAKETIQTIKLKCKVTNDNNSNDLKNYNIAIEKVKNNTGMDFREPSKEDEITITAQNKKINIQNKNYYASTLKLNGYDIELHDDTLLPIYSYLAQLTTKMTNYDTTTTAQREYTQGINKLINKKACEYLEISS